MTSLEVLYEQYATLLSNYRRLSTRCADDDPDPETQHERIARLQSAYKRAYRNYQTALNRRFRENNAQVAAIRSQIQDAQVEVARMVNRIRRIDDVLAAISKAIGLGSRLVGLGT